MAQSPSRKDTFSAPKPGRNVTDLAAIVRHQGSYLRSLDPGMLGGRFGIVQPVRPGTSGLVGEGDDDGSGESEQPQFWNRDAATATTVGKIVLALTFVPVDGSLHVRWNGVDQPPTDWTLAGRTVTFIDPHVKVGHKLTAAYAYYPGDIEGPEITSPEDGSTTTDTTPTITGTGAEGRTIEVFVDGVSIGTDIVSGGTWAVTSGALPGGQHETYAVQVEPDGLDLTSDTVTFDIIVPDLDSLYLTDVQTPNFWLLTPSTEYGGGFSDIYGHAAATLLEAGVGASWFSYIVCRLGNGDLVIHYTDNATFWTPNAAGPVTEDSHRTGMFANIDGPVVIGGGFFVNSQGPGSPGYQATQDLPQDNVNGRYGVTDMSQCAYYWGEQIAITGDAREVPIGPVGGAP